MAGAVRQSSTKEEVRLAQNKPQPLAGHAHVRELTKSLFSVCVCAAGFFHQFYLWMLVKALKPAHIIETGAYNGLGTWMLRQAAPDAQIIVVSPQTPHLYVDKHSSSRYFTAEFFRDFAAIDWSCVHGLVRNDTLVFVDDHQSGYRRMLEAHARGFHNLVFDDNEMPSRSDHFSVKGACAAANGVVKGDSTWDDFRGIVDDWGRWRRGYFNVSAEQMTRVGESFKHAVDIYAEMPPVWLGDLSSPFAPRPLLKLKDAESFHRQHNENLRSIRAEAVAYQHFLYVRTRPSVKSKKLYYPEQVRTNDYTGIQGKLRTFCDGGATPSMLAQTREGDDSKRNLGSGRSTKFASFQ